MKKYLLVMVEARMTEAGTPQHIIYEEDADRIKVEQGALYFYHDRTADAIYAAGSWIMVREYDAELSRADAEED